MTLGTILIILVIIYLVGGLSGRFGGYGYGLGHSGMGVGGVVLVVLIVLLLLGKCKRFNYLILFALFRLRSCHALIHHLASRGSHFCQIGLY